ncbi:MAG: undecaprenyldiphospho-muramoylpentapeptide beta-N-acetylglucosaminyltransferase [Fimbriimonadaceae bacterium]|nr:undecaprenyldiphospho-muramoylpentapeptide beta-N-acetylglucosaminyltransferase [Fimbriimonadaceae bacterium]
MRLIVTGGGTGGHIYPALEVAQAARHRGYEVVYYGSERGQERAVIEKARFNFRAFPSQPLYKVTTVRGLKAMMALAKATGKAIAAMRNEKSNVVFATGGYASAPVLQAAKKLGVPYVIHEQNSVPGRTNLLMSHRSFAVCTVFECASDHFPKDKVVRTGMPVRQALRDCAQGRLFEHGSAHPAPMVFVMGGSQGSVALNDAALSCAVRMSRSEVQWVHVTGPDNYESTLASREKLGIRSEYAVHPYLQADDLGAALFSSSICVCRSGAGTMAELAAFRKPSILVPYPHAFGNHQQYNADEFVRIGAARVLSQNELSPMSLEARILAWLEDKDAQAEAQRALAAWDLPDATDRVLEQIKMAGSPVS